MWLSSEPNWAVQLVKPKPGDSQYHNSVQFDGIRVVIPGIKNPLKPGFNHVANWQWTLNPINQWPVLPKLNQDQKKTTKQLKLLHSERLEAQKIQGWRFNNSSTFQGFCAVFKAQTKSQWHHNECHGVLNNRRLDCWFNSLFRRKSKKTSKHRFTSLCEGNPTVIGGSPSKRASNYRNELCMA